MFNLCQNQKETTTIIDSNGEKAGELNYSLMLEMLDEDQTTPVNMKVYETLNEAIGKYIKFKFEIDSAMDIPEKLSHKSMCTYEWIDHDETIFETEEIDMPADIQEDDPDFNYNPEFNYKAEHTIQITEELCTHMMYSTLGINVYGMIESKRQKKLEEVEEEYESEIESSEEEKPATGTNSYAKRRSIALNRSNTSKQTKIKMLTQEELIAELEAENAKLAKTLEAAAVDNKKSKLCTIF